MDTFNPDLKRYREYLEGLLREQSSKIIMNGGVEHAAVLMSTLFDNTKQEILMYCRGLNPKLTNDESYFHSFSDYIEKGGKLSLMVETLEYSKISKTFSFLINQQNKFDNHNIEIKIITPEDKKEIFKVLKSDECNFSVFDDKMIRFEYDPTNYKALASFNYTDMAKYLSTVFYDAYTNASPFPADN